MSKLLSQGGFGCVYYPGLKCSGKGKPSNKRVTKLQRKDDSAENELLIGSIVKSIPRYKYNFSPVLSICPLSLADVKKSLLEKCEIVKKDKDVEYVLMEMDYIKNEPFDKMIETSSDKDIMKTLLEGYRFLLNSFSLLLSKRIVHFDIKLENVLFEVNTKNPIIIDFGISINMNDVTADVDNLKKYFYIFAPDYYLWPLEVHLLAYFAKINGTSSLNEKDIARIVNQFVDKNDILKQFDDVFVGKYRSNCFKTLNRYIGKNPHNVINMLLESYTTWDNYALSIMYLNIFNFLFDQGFKKNVILTKFHDVLTTNISPNFRERLTVQETTERFNKLLYSKYDNIYQDLIDTVSFNIDTVVEHVKTTNIKLQRAVRK